MSRTTTSTAAVAAGAISFSILLAGCVPGGSAGKAADQEVADIITDGSAIPETTITAIDTFGTDGPQQRWIEQVQAEFQEEYPQITVVRETGTFEDINATLRLRLSESDGPDIVPANQGWQGVGELGTSGLLLNLDGYADAHGWVDRVPEAIIRQHQVSKDGKNIGTGSLFGMPANTGGFINVYFNRAKLDALGADIPTSFGEFEEILADAKSAGEVPISLGAGNQQASATLLALTNVYGNADDINDFVYATGDVEAADTGLTEAAAKFQDWALNGYFPAGFEGETQEKAIENFIAGTGVFQIYYSDYIPFPDVATADTFGNFLLPHEGGGAVVATGSAAVNFSIAANSDSKDAAALYLDFLSSTRAGETAIQNGISPILDDYEPDTDSANLNDELVSLQLVNASGGIVPYLDWATPTLLNDAINPKMDELLQDRATPEDVVAAVQANVDAFRAEKDSE